MKLFDFGTSSTVAVVRLGDGRTAPLLFGESPVLPSAVCLTAASELPRAAAAVAGLPEPAFVEELSAVLLVGGSSRMTLAPTLLHRALGVARTVIEQPELIVAAGTLHTPAPPAAPVSTPSPAAPASPPAAPAAVSPAGPLASPPAGASAAPDAGPSAAPSAGASAGPSAGPPTSRPARPGGPEAAVPEAAAAAPVAPVAAGPQQTPDRSRRRLLVGAAAGLVLAGTAGVVHATSRGRRGEPESGPSTPAPSGVAPSGRLELVGHLPAHARPVTAVAYSPAQKLIASAGADFVVCLFDLSDPASPQPRAELGDHGGVVRSAAFPAAAPPWRRPATTARSSSGAPRTRRNRRS